MQRLQERRVGSTAYTCPQYLHCKDSKYALDKSLPGHFSDGTMGRISPVDLTVTLACEAARFRAGAFLTARLRAGAFLTARLRAGAFLTARLRAGAFLTARLRAGAFLTARFRAGAFLTARLRAGAFFAAVFRSRVVRFFAAGNRHSPFTLVDVASAGRVVSRRRRVLFEQISPCDPQRNRYPAAGRLHGGSQGCRLRPRPQP